MGTHGIGLFDDDDGADFSDEILRSRDIDVIVDALKAVPEADWEFVEHPVGVRALLAAELVADQMGHESGDLADDLHSWIHEFGDADDDLIRLARDAVERVLRDSETRALWKDSPSFGDWESKTRDLAQRLRWR